MSSCFVLNGNKAEQADITKTKLTKIKLSNIDSAVTKWYNLLEKRSVVCMFIGREKELQELTDKLSGRKFEAVLLYGRRRIGKTELIRRAAERFNGKFLYYECKKSLFSDNIVGLNELLKKAFGYNSAFQSFGRS